MELDELKKSWNMLDARLPQAPLIDEKQLAKLIEQYKRSTHRSLHRLSGFQRSSLIAGSIVITLCILAGCIFSLTTDNSSMRLSIFITLLYFCLTLIAGIWWDSKTWHWTRNTNIDTMSVAEVSRRMVTLRRWTRYELYAIALWMIPFNLLYCWTTGIFAQGVYVTILTIFFLLLIEAIPVTLLYKRMIYKHLDSIHRNLEELEDICTE